MPLTPPFLVPGFQGGFAIDAGRARKPKCRQTTLVERRETEPESGLAPVPATATALYRTVKL